MGKYNTVLGGTSGRESYVLRSSCIGVYHCVSMRVSDDACVSWDDLAGCVEMAGTYCGPC